MNQPENKRRLPPVTLADSYQICRKRVNGRLAPWRWIAGHLDSERKQALDAILALTVRSEKLCDIHLARAARMELLEDLREDFRNNFMEEESTDQFPALLETMNRYAIPQQYLHDIVAAADMCVRIDRFANFDQWLQLGYRLGGGTLLASIPVVESEREDYQAAAMSLGQAIYLTHFLNDIADEIQKLEYFLPSEDVDTFQVDLSRHNPARPSPGILQLFGCQVERIEQLYQEGRSLVSYLSLDGRRMIRSLVDVSWDLLMKMKRDPSRPLMESIQLSQKDWLKFRWKHLMGLEGKVSVLSPDSGHEHQ